MLTTPGRFPALLYSNISLIHFMVTTFIPIPCTSHFNVCPCEKTIQLDYQKKSGSSFLFREEMYYSGLHLRFVGQWTPTLKAGVLPELFISHGRTPAEHISYYRPASSCTFYLVPRLRATLLASFVRERCPELVGKEQDGQLSDVDPNLVSA